MGAGDSKGFKEAAETLVSEQGLHQQEFQHRMAHRAFAMCVVPTSEKGVDSNSASAYELSDEERRCVEEFALLYRVYYQKGTSQFRGLYSQFQRDQMAKAQMMAMEAQARQNLAS